MMKKLKIKKVLTCLAVMSLTCSLGTVSGHVSTVESSSYDRSATNVGLFTYTPSRVTHLDHSRLPLSNTVLAAYMPQFNLDNLQVQGMPTRFWVRLTRLSEEASSVQLAINGNVVNFVGGSNHVEMFVPANPCFSVGNGELGMIGELEITNNEPVTGTYKLELLGYEFDKNGKEQLRNRISRHQQERQRIHDIYSNLPFNIL